MSLTERDRKILMGAIPVLLLLVYWFMLLAPKRKEASAAAETLTTEQAKLADAESRASTLTAAKTNFAADYAAVLRLGKAVPTSVDMPSLLLQLDQAAKGTSISFEKVSVGERETSQSAAVAPPPGGAGAAPTPAAPGGEPAASGPGQSAESASAAVDSTNQANQAAASADPSAAPPAPGAAPAAGTAAPATGGPLEKVPLEFSFRGSFFELANFFHRLKRFVYVSGDQVKVRGRLLTIESVKYVTDPATFPVLTADVSATVYLTPKAEGAVAGATPSGPAPAAAAPVPGTSTASTGSTAPPTPTATTTP
jgi:hypothetical protein